MATGVAKGQGVAPQLVGVQERLQKELRRNSLDYQLASRPAYEELVEAASSGTLGTRRLKEFGRLLPLFAGAAMVHAGDFPWDEVSSEGASACA